MIFPLARAYVVTMRPYLCFVSGVTGLVGLASTSLSPLPLVVLGFAFFASYGFGQALTDTTQIDTDSLSSPYRPLVRGEISPAQVLRMSITGLVLCGGVLVLYNPRCLLVAPLAIAGLALYTPMKRRFWAGPIWNAWIVALLPLLGALADGRGFRAALGAPTATAFFGYLTFVLLGYLKDVEADRQTGYDTLPVRYGRRATTLVSGACALAAIAFAALVPGRSPAASVLWLLGSALLLGAHARAWRNTRDADAHRPIVIGLVGYVALQLGEAVALRPSLLSIALAALPMFVLALRARPCQEQV